ncbi:MAG: twin-arginine translocase TatA/TatE family subunit [Magnetococcales bacterium]|nr:twin-arginine translocase TatA/TatE family subunit [Magnetococcales bacterium]
MFGLSWFEFFVILVVALLVIGPDKLPEVARGLARVIRQFQRIVNDVRDSIHMEDLEAKMRESSHYTPPPPPPPTLPQSTPATMAPIRPADPQPPVTGQTVAPADPTPSTPNKNDPARP